MWSGWSAQTSGRQRIPSPFFPITCRFNEASLSPKYELKQFGPPIGATPVTRPTSRVIWSDLRTHWSTRLKWCFSSDSPHARRVAKSASGAGPFASFSPIVESAYMKNNMGSKSADSSRMTVNDAHTRLFALLIRRMAAVESYCSSVVYCSAFDISFFVSVLGLRQRLIPCKARQETPYRTLAFRGWC